MKSKEDQNGKANHYSMEIDPLTGATTKIVKSAKHQNIVHTTPIPLEKAFYYKK